jgi:hypothetical protein
MPLADSLSLVAMVKKDEQVKRESLSHQLALRLLKSTILSLY